MEIVEGVLPSLSGVGINLPAVLLVSSGPVRNLKALEESPVSSVEGNLSYTLRQSFRVEILSINVVHIIRLLMELVYVEVFNSDTNFPSFLNMESVSNKCKIRMEEPDDIANSSLNLISRIEDQFDPTKE